MGLQIAAPDEVPDRVRANFSPEAVELWEEEELDSERPGHFRQPDEDDEIVDWVSSYLQGDIDGQNHRAHQYTVNHVTYPFVRDEHFAAFPLAPPLSDESSDREDITPAAHERQLQLFAGASAVSPGDLMFFYKSDSQSESTEDYDDYENDLERNRGIVGVYRALSEAFIDWSETTHTLSNSKGFRISGRCDKCGCVFSWMKGGHKQGPGSKYDNKGGGWCPGSALYDDHEFGHHVNANTQKGRLTLSGRIRLEPVVQYSLPATDNSVYGTLEGDSVVWTGRFDNAMGSGKGSTIRHLLPEEAMQLTRLLEEQADALTDVVDAQTKRIGAPTSEYPGSSRVLPLMYYNGVPVTYSQVVSRKPLDKLSDADLIGEANAESLKEAGFESVNDVWEADEESLTEVSGIGPTTVQEAKEYIRDARADPQYRTEVEAHLHLNMTQSANKSSNFVDILSDISNKSAEKLLEELEYYCWEFPWGFANDQADFVATYRTDTRQHVFLIECKREDIESAEPLVQLMLYVPWTAKVTSRYARPAVDEIEITPVLLGQQQGDDWDGVLTNGYDFDYTPRHGGHHSDITVQVNDAEFITYNSNGADIEIHDDLFSQELQFSRSSNHRRANWSSKLSSLSATKRETRYVADRWPDNL